MERRLSPHDHPAVRAWRQLAGPAAAPEDLVELERTWKKRKARPVYRLARSSAPAFRVFAKPCRRDEADRTVEIYRDVLPHIPLRVPSLIGFVAAENSDRVWLFTEQIDGEEYRPEIAHHRKLSGAWLATLHTAASRLPTPALAQRPYLYDIASPGIVEHLETATSLIAEYLTEGVADSNNRSLLEALSRQCSALRKHLGALQSLGELIPRTLVHGDFCVSNMLVTRRGDEDALAVFDWQRAGWATPAFDLTRFLGSWAAPELAAYLDVARRSWSDLDEMVVLRLAYTGEILRWIEALRWEVERLGFGWHAEPMSRLAIYREWMDDIRRNAPWSDDGAPPGRTRHSVVPYGRPPRLEPGAPVHA